MYSFPRRFVFVFLLLSPAIYVQAQTAAGTITGTVTDASGAVIPGAAVTIENPVSGLDRKAITDATGQFQFTNLPLNPYHLTAKKDGFTALVQDVEVRSFVPIALKLALQVGTAATTVTVTGEDLVENDSSLHTDLDRGAFEKVPLESKSSSMSSLVTLASPGVAADSNGLFHGLGDHA